jgi:prepilin-type N-terminal cleavage/methylation domain-containing protein
MLTFFVTQRKIWQGYSLVELLVAILLLGILASVAIPRLSHTSEQAATGKAQAFYANFSTALNTYRADLMAQGMPQNYESFAVSTLGYPIPVSANPKGCIDVASHFVGMLPGDFSDDITSDLNADWYVISLTAAEGEIANFLGVEQPAPASKLLCYFVNIQNANNMDIIAYSPYASPATELLLQSTFTHKNALDFFEKLKVAVFSAQNGDAPNFSPAKYILAGPAWLMKRDDVSTFTRNADGSYQMLLANGERQLVTSSGQLLKKSSVDSSGYVSQTEYAYQEGKLIQSTMLVTDAAGKKAQTLNTTYADNQLSKSIDTKYDTNSGKPLAIVKQEYVNGQVQKTENTVYQYLANGTFTQRLSSAALSSEKKWQPIIEDGQFVWGGIGVSNGKSFPYLTDMKVKYYKSKDSYVQITSSTQNASWIYYAKQLYCRTPKVNNDGQFLAAGGGGTLLRVSDQASTLSAFEDFCKKIEFPPHCQ